MTVVKLDNAFTWRVGEQELIPNIDKKTVFRLGRPQQPQQNQQNDVEHSVLMGPFSDVLRHPFEGTGEHHRGDYDKIQGRND